MLVKDCMTRHPVMIASTMSATEAQRLMVDNKLHHLPVVGDGKRLVGLITRQRLALKPDILGSLNIWEITRQVADLKVKDVMLKSKDIYTIDPEKTVERAAQILEEHQIGCLPVIEDSVVVGLITETDLLQSYQAMLGLPAKGIRVTIRMPNQRGEFAKLMQVLSDHGWGVMGIGTYPAPRREGFYDVVLKIPSLSADEVKAAFSQIDSQEIIDIRDSV